MNWSADDQRAVANVLLGSWPGTITGWGKDAFAAYLGELQARELTAEDTIRAIRACGGGDFPPSAPNLAAVARKDPSAPTFEEALKFIHTAMRAGTRPLTGNYSDEAEMLKARERMIETEAQSLHPLVGAFIVRYRISALQDDLERLWDEQYGAIARRDLERAWVRHCEAMEGRQVAEIAFRSARGTLGRPDFAGVLGTGE